MSCRGRDLCGKHELLQGRPYRQWELYTDKKELPLYSEIKAVSNAGYATEADALTGNKTLVIAASVSAEAWGGETAAGSGGTITLP